MAEQVAALLDDGQRMGDWMDNTGAPILNVAGSDLRFVTWADRGADAAFAYLGRVARR